ncbi:MAG: hypothetical protein ABSG67_03135 [Thermoguttaceae bacterium]|jgi:hypothetical protein
MHIEKAYRPVAEAKKKSGESNDGLAGGRGKTKNLPPSCGKVSADPHAHETVAIAAAAVGMGKTTYEKACIKHRPGTSERNTSETGRPIRKLWSCHADKLHLKR